MGVIAHAANRVPMPFDSQLAASFTQLTNIVCHIVTRQSSVNIGPIVLCVVLINCVCWQRWNPHPNQLVTYRYSINNASQFIGGNSLLGLGPACLFQL